MGARGAVAGVECFGYHTPLSLAGTLGYFGFSYFLAGHLCSLSPPGTWTGGVNCLHLPSVMGASLLLPLGQAACNWPVRLRAVSPSGPSASWLLSVQFGFLFAGRFREFTARTQPLSPSSSPLPRVYLFSVVPADVCPFLPEKL